MSEFGDRPWDGWATVEGTEIRDPHDSLVVGPGVRLAVYNRGTGHDEPSTGTSCKLTHGEAIELARALLWFVSGASL